jgi:hypothetical protein
MTQTRGLPAKLIPDLDIAISDVKLLRSVSGGSEVHRLRGQAISYGEQFQLIGENGETFGETAANPLIGHNGICCGPNKKKSKFIGAHGHDISESSVWLPARHFQKLIHALGVYRIQYRFCLIAGRRGGGADQESKHADDSAIAGDILIPHESMLVSHNDSVNEFA